MSKRHSHLHMHGHPHVYSGMLESELDQRGDLQDRTTVVISAGENSSTKILARANAPDEKPVGNTTTLIIVLSIVIPLVLAFGVLFYLHRRGQARLRREDAADKYKSLDFGFEAGSGEVGKGNKRRSVLFGKEKNGNHKNQLSMDMNLSSPYLLPPTLQHSRESLHSLARTLQQDDDPYRPIANYTGSDVGSLRSFKKGADGDLVYTGRTRSSGDRDSSRMPPINTNVLPGQRSIPPSPLQQLPPAAQPPQRKAVAVDAHHSQTKNEFRFADDGAGTTQVLGVQEPAAVASQVSRKNTPQQSRPSSKESSTVGQPYVAGLVNERDSIPSAQSQAHKSSQGSSASRPRMSQASTKILPARTTSLTPSEKPRKESMPAIEPSVMEEYQGYTNHFQVDTHAQRQMEYEQQHEYPLSAGLGVPNQDNRRLSVGLRPLPPTDYLESEDPEFRANRIRSFYKEYFEEMKGDRGRPPPMPEHAGYYEDYDQNYLGEAAFFDPDSNAFVMPYAQPVTRRAMTPPPKSRRPMPGPRPRGPSGASGGPQGRARAESTMSAGQWGPRSPRPGSSASNPRFGGKPKKPLPPPSILTTLPTPSKLRDDSFALMGATEFAPPPTFRDQAAGRSQSPVGERRLYALNTPIHSPLVSAFDDTPALPSPHLLRKSGTFTALDFAPPRRFKDADTMSETGSIHSNHSGISTANLSAIRAGAGRVSRLPGDTVFTQAAMMGTLKPQWSMRD